MTIAVIPARGGSKRISRKNLKDFLGKPVIAYAIEAACSSGLFEHVVVSTEDEQIAQTAEHYGAAVPFRRPFSLADDETTTDSVLAHALTECRKLYGEFRYCCCIYPTNPFVGGDLLRSGLKLLTAHSATSAFPVTAYDFPIEQAFTLDGVRPRPRWPESLSARSQDLAVHFHDAGMFYWCDVEKFMITRQLFTEDSVAFVVAGERCQDINTPEDWTRAEQKYLFLQRAESAS